MGRYLAMENSSSQAPSQAEMDAGAIIFLSRRARQQAKMANIDRTVNNMVKPLFSAISE
jgi:hypothetical protein